MPITVLHEDIKYLVHISALVLDIVDTSRSAGRDDDVDFSVSLNIAQVSHKITELAIGLSFFKS